MISYNIFSVAFVVCVLDFSPSKFVLSSSTSFFGFVLNFLILGLPKPVFEPNTACNPGVVLCCSSS